MRLGTTDSVPLLVYTHRTVLDGNDFPIALFKFKYRSEGEIAGYEIVSMLTIFTEALKQLLILKRSPTSSPEPEPEASTATPLDLESLNAEQKRKLDGFLQELTVSPIDNPLIDGDHSPTNHLIN